jgi:3-hydroxy acid dehydrogenase/malonic semialdehyde reductase
VDVLVNNAGLALGIDHIADVSESAFDTMVQISTKSLPKQFAVNVKGAMNVMQAVLPAMKVVSSPL